MTRSSWNSSSSSGSSKSKFSFGTFEALTLKSSLTTFLVEDSLRWLSSSMIGVSPNFWTRAFGLSMEVTEGWRLRLGVWSWALERLG